LTSDLSDCGELKLLVDDFFIIDDPGADEFCIDGEIVCSINIQRQLLYRKKIYTELNENLLLDDSFVIILRSDFVVDFDLFNHFLHKYYLSRKFAGLLFSADFSSSCFSLYYKSFGQISDWLICGSSLKIKNFFKNLILFDNKDLIISKKLFYKNYSGTIIPKYNCEQYVLFHTLGFRCLELKLIFKIIKIYFSSTFIRPRNIGLKVLKYEFIYEGYRSDNFFKRVFRSLLHRSLTHSSNKIFIIFPKFLFSSLIIIYKLLRLKAGI
jgi:hypothetical protein